jgi:putative transposase
VQQDAYSSQIVNWLNPFFPSTMLENHAEEHGVVEQEGKLQIPALVWAFVFGFVTGESRTLAAFRRSYSTADKKLPAGGLYHRLIS